MKTFELSPVTDCFGADTDFHLNIRFCCAKMYQALLNGIIKLPKDINQLKVTIPSISDDGISFCPWCGSIVNFSEKQITFP